MREDYWLHVVTDVVRLDGARLGTFLREAHSGQPICKRLMRALWGRLKHVKQIASLLRLERNLGELVAQERSGFMAIPLFIPLKYEPGAASDPWRDNLDDRIIKGLDEFARHRADEDVAQRFFPGEANKGLRLPRVMLDRYDEVVTKPPYMSRAKMNTELENLVYDAYPDGRHDLFATFTLRNLEFVGERGYVGILTTHAWMFPSSYEGFHKTLRDQIACVTTAHCGGRLFDVGDPGTLQTTAFVLRYEPDTMRRENHVGTYFRLVHARRGEGKRLAFEEAPAALRSVEPAQPLH